MELYSNIDAGLVFLLQTCLPSTSRLQISASRGENVLVANLEIIEEEGNVV